MGGAPWNQAWGGGGGWSPNQAMMMGGGGTTGGFSPGMVGGWQAQMGKDVGNQAQPASWFPWGSDWTQTPWSGMPKDQAQQQMAWMNVGLPWLQAAMQGQQWGQEFDWRKAMDEWQQQFQGGQFEWQKEQDVWARGLQEQQLQQQRALEEARQQSQEEQTTMQTFGRRWKPTTRWM